ncbi:murein biosynthesis integral membrane protein MurJ [Sphingomonas astaxanthinifaciens]|uniref:Probable lipid II flippase MurJ n=1 Tax=Sphingomonas astaxanthinifaciens DSM 22298 TaxID=1123267 RepID=A0ABQ5Z504_9SPHN|nr:murein biosynthesis integral membrane protein MurJ [Sphingomonas astaxanthinifaciens]GLR47879.1 putative lipid II flippase MurJ [Sphingomonas astaxanthinifaciens DSM 22298]
MNLLKSTGTIGGLTMVSRILGFGREMLTSRILGASNATDAFVVAFRLPNTFRRLFGEGAFSAGFVPLFSQRLHGEGGAEEARKFSEEVLAVFLPTLILFTLVFQVIMGPFVAALSGYVGDKLEFTTFLTRITFPYLLLISLVSLFSGILNSLTRFTAAAFAPALLNLMMMIALLVVPEGGKPSATALAVAVTLGGVVQLALLLIATKRAGISLRLRRPRMTPGVRQFVRVVVPATLGAGVYQISAFIDTFFLTRLGTGAPSYFNFADRLNQLPLGVIGAALGTAILPQISRHVGAGEPDKAATIQAQAAELAMLLCLPAALALCAAAEPLVGALFQGGKFSAADTAVTAQVLAIIVLGLPAYVLVKVLTPGFYSRQDTGTPVKIAAVVLVANVVLNFALIPFFGIAGLSAVVAFTSWLNCAILYVILHRRGHFRMPGWLGTRILRQFLAAGAMVAAIYVVRQLIGDWFTGGLGHRLVGLAVLIGSGLAVYFPLVWVLGGVDRDAFLALLRRKRPVADAG